MITAEQARALWDYKAETGDFVWRVSKGTASAGYTAGRLRKSDGYIVLGFEYKEYAAHRVAWLWTHGQWPHEIDHINGIRTDNRLTNLRECTRAQNMANRPRHSRKQFPKGVALERRTGRYTAKITVNRQCRYLGTFDTIQQASDAYMVEARKAHGEFARAD